MSNPVIGWAQENPLVAGVAAIGVIVVVMAVMGGGSEGGDSSGGAAVAAYYAAVGQQTQAGNAVQIAQIQANATTNQTLIAATYGLDTAKVTADVQKTAISSQERVESSRQTHEYLIAQQWIPSNERIAANNNVRMAAVAREESKAAKYQAQGSGNTAAGIISSIGGAAGNISKAIGSVAGLF